MQGACRRSLSIGPFTGGRLARRAGNRPGKSFAHDGIRGGSNRSAGFSSLASAGTQHVRRFACRCGILRGERLGAGRQWRRFKPDIGAALMGMYLGGAVSLAAGRRHSQCGAHPPCAATLGDRREDSTDAGPLSRTSRSVHDGGAHRATAVAGIQPNVAQRFPRDVGFSARATAGWNDTTLDQATGWPPDNVRPSDGSGLRIHGPRNARRCPTTR